MNMLEITIPEQEIFIEKTNEFVNFKETKLQLEHSLISVKKWEEKWHKPFLKDKDKNSEELTDYIRCMTINKNVDQRIYRYIPAHLIDEISKYIKDPATATTINEDNLPNGIGKTGEGVTAEIIYYWMIALNIPVEFQKWHLNSLITLIRVTSIKNGPKRKMSRKEEQSQRAALNAARRAKHHTKG